MLFQSQTTEPNVFVTMVVPLVTLLNLLLGATLALSEIRKRRSDARNSDVTSDTKMMDSIKQASLDLLNAVKAENAGLLQERNEDQQKIEQQAKENEHLRAVILDLEIRLAKCERCLQSQQLTCPE